MAAVRSEALDGCPGPPARDVAGRRQLLVRRAGGQETGMPFVAEPATAPIPLISVCVCTCRRPAQLEQLVNTLGQPATKGLFRFSVLVVGNDAHQSARRTVEAWAGRWCVCVTYGV